ncbi:MAG: GH92 family glycosyl hydrolase [Christiangramia sp.]|uniref:GH92 family glycosyl hydrolase n=1 Tax=Christiangramia sp. TaxID=1931228 RepID=UPI0032424007
MKKVLLFLATSTILISCKTEVTSENEVINRSGQKMPFDYVNTFIGTAPLTNPDSIGYTPPRDWRVWAGLTFPGSSLPNAMVQLSPITKFGSGAGYEYEDNQIIAFTHTNKGHWNLCNIPVLPVSENATYPFKSSFDHQNESATPGYYQVKLDDYGINVELTSTLRAGYHKYQFKENAEKQIVFKLGEANNRVNNWDIQQVSENEVSGIQDMGGDKIYFHAMLNAPIEKLIRIQEKEDQKAYALIRLGNSPSEVTMKIGLSFVNAENAKENLKKEIGDKTFDEVREEAQKIWTPILDGIVVDGGTEKQKQLFYSSLYRTFLWPALRSDVNNDFAGPGNQKMNRGHRFYTNPSLWDTYRNKLVMMEIFQPEVTADIIKSLIVRGEEKGFIPTFFHGDHAASFIAGSYLRGINDFDVDKAYEFLLNNAYKEGGTRPHINEYIEKGYISDADVEKAHTETKSNAGVSKTLEYSYDDYSLAQLAVKMNDQEHYDDLMQRSQNFENVFDKQTNFMRGRLENGEWITPFDSEYPYYEYMYREANAWQVSFFAPHDMPKLVELYGGNKAFEQKLDSLFTVKWNPQHIARNVSSFIGQYCIGNQPDHEAPFSYYFIDKPGKSQAILDTILNDFYGIGDTGLALPGMDDAGEMSAWYVMTAGGLYSFSATDPEYLVTVPIFDEVTWNLPNGNSLNIKHSEGRNLDGIQLNGKELDGYFLSHDELENGGTLMLETN